MKIKNIRNISEDYELLLSTDDTKNINFVTGNLDTGYEILFNKMKSYLSGSKSTDIELELEGDWNHDVKDIFFSEEETRYYEDLDYVNRLELDKNTLEDIVKKARAMLQTIHGVFDYEHSLPRVEHGRVVRGDQSLAKEPQTIASIAMRLALVNQRGDRLPMIFENCLCYNYGFGKRLIEMIAKHSEQALFFEYWPTIMVTPRPSPWHEEPVDFSIYGYAKHIGVLGSTYELVRDGVPRRV